MEARQLDEDVDKEALNHILALECKGLECVVYFHMLYKCRPWGNGEEISAKGNVVIDCEPLCFNEQSVVVLCQTLIGLPLIRQVKAGSFIIPRRSCTCFCLSDNNSHKVWSFQSVKMLRINIGLFSFCLLFISSNYHSKGGVFLARRWGNRRLKGNEETSVSLLCHKSASHSYHWHPNRQRLQRREKSETPRRIGLANRGKGYHRNTYLTWVYGLHPITCYQLP